MNDFMLSLEYIEHNCTKCTMEGCAGDECIIITEMVNCTKCTMEGRAGDDCIIITEMVDYK